LRRYKMRIFLIIILLLTAPANIFAEDKGKALYDAWCAQCHGYEGKGDGYAKDFTFPKPRDFTVGTYKFTSTPTGDPPTDEDLKRMIRDGNPGTSMPAWRRFSDEEVTSLINYLKKFASDVFTSKPTPVKITKVPSCSDDMIKKGREIEEKTAKCWECHGKEGRGDGEKSWQENFKDDWGNPILPADHTHPWEFRKGGSLEDIYLTITTGNKGTPMTSYQDTLSDDERWALACYIKSRQQERRLGVSLMVKKTPRIPSAEDRTWDKTDYLDLPLAGQIMFEPRNFTPNITNVRIRGLYTDTEVGIMLEWTDKKPNKGDDGMPPDTVRIQFPVKSGEKPYFFMGDKKNPVYIWSFNARDNMGVEFNANGPGNLMQQESKDIMAEGFYRNGLYRVLFRRPLITKDDHDTRFETGRFIPFSVSIFDGRNREEGNRATISAWYYMILEPPTPVKVYVLPPLVTIVFLAGGVFLHIRMRKK